MAIVRLQHQGNTLSTGYTTLQTASSGLTSLGYIVRAIALTNVISATSTVNTARNIDVHLVADTSTPAALNRIFSGALTAGNTVLLPGPWWGTSGAMVQARIADSGAGADIAVRITAFHETTA